MPPFDRWPALARAAVLLAGVLWLPACGVTPTEPTPPATVHRTVTAVVSDSLGGPSAYGLFVWTALFDSAGVTTTIVAGGDGAGENLQVLTEGPWLVYAQRVPHTGQVAGASFAVSGPQRALADTQVVELALHTASRVSGTATLAGRSDHSGILVSCAGAPFLGATTDATGAWSIDGLPLGRWTLRMEKLGFKVGMQGAVVASPGSNLTLPPIRLISDP